MFTEEDMPSPSATTPLLHQTSGQSHYSGLATSSSVKDVEESRPSETRATSPDIFINVSKTRFWIIFGSTLLGYLLACFDTTFIASSYPIITSEFHASNKASWLSTTYLLTSTTLMPLLGRLSDPDALGRKSVYLFSIALFLIATAWCGLAQSIESLIAARAFCGIGAGGIFSMGQIISSDLVHLEHRGTYQAHITLCLGIGSGLGTAFGGLLCDYIGWRGTFNIQLPFILLHLILVAWAIPSTLGSDDQKTQNENVEDQQTHDQQKRNLSKALHFLESIDLLGSFLLVICLASLIIGLNLGGNVYPWGHPLIISSLVAAVVFGVVFVRYERHTPFPVLPMKLLSKNPTSSIIIGNFFGAMSIQTMIFNAPIYFQAVKQLSPTMSGLSLIGSSVGVTISSVSTGLLINRTKSLKLYVLLGGIFMVIGGLTEASMGLTTPLPLSMVFVSFSGLSQGFTYPTLMMSILATAQDSKSIAITTLGLGRNLGSIMGISVSSWIFQTIFISELKHQITGDDKEQIINWIRESTHAIAQLSPLHRTEAINSYIVALQGTFISAAVWGAIMFLLLVRIRLPKLTKSADRD